MFGPTQPHTTTSICPASFADSSSCVGEDAVNEHATNIVATDLGIVALTEIDYTQLQQLLCPHIESQSNAGDGSTRMSAPFLPSSDLPNAPQYSSGGGTEGQNASPAVRQPPDNSMGHASQTLVHLDFQELRMMMLSESNLPSPSGDMTTKHPNNTGGDSLGAVPKRVKPASDINELNKENENLGCLSETRMKSTVRVRLEDRFKSLPTDVPTCTEMPEAGVTTNNLVTIIRRPSQLIGTQQPGKWTRLVKNKAALSTLQLVNSNLNLQTTTPTRSSDPPLTQPSSSPSCGVSCPLLEAAKNQEISLSRGFSYYYQQNLASRNNLLPEEVLVDDTLCRQSIKKRSRVQQSGTDMERRVLCDIRNTCRGTPSIATQGSAAEQTTDSKQIALTQRRERHNRMERDRRRRIRVCCDELNNLVPFCTVETDKATTLQWTTAFLKYLQERHGDTLKKEFEAVFSGGTGRQLKVCKSEGSAEEEAREQLLPGCQ